MKDYVWIRRIADGKMLDIPKSDLTATLKRGGFEIVVEVSAQQLAEAPVVSVFDPGKCILCGFEAKNANGLRLHKQSKHQ